jgi:hypothetical protein
MSDPKKPRNPANALFGLDDVPIEPRRERQSSAPQGSESGTGPGSPAGYYPNAPTVNFGTRRAAETQESQSGGRPPGAASVSQPPPGTDAGPGPLGAAPGAPQVVYVQAPPTPAPQPIRSGNKGLWVLVIILLALAGTTLDLLRAARQQFHAALNEQAEQVLLLKRRADSSDLRYAQLSGEFRVTAEKLGLTQAELTRARRFASKIEQEQKQSVTALNAAISQKASAQQLQALQSQSAAQLGELSGNLQKGLAASQDALSGAKTELTGAIAHTHSELVALAHRTDRDYFEFALNRRGAQEKIGGGLQVQLIRTNPKMNLFTVDLFFDDKRTQRRNQSIDSPVFFYMQGASNAIELVVNKIGKNAVRGYVSTPKGFIVNGRNVLSARPTA